MMDQTTERTGVLIVGAGPYGIAIAQELHRRAIPFVIVGRTFGLWLHHTLTDVELRSDCQASQIYDAAGELGFESYYQDNPNRRDTMVKDSGRIPVREFRQYLNHVESKLPFEVREHRLTKLIKTDSGFLGEVDDGPKIIANAVVLATGVEPHQYLPPALKEFSQERVFHSFRVSEYEQLRGQKLCVVGRGQSAGETIQVLGGKNEITWVHHRPPVFHLDPLNLPRPVFEGLLKASHTLSYLPRFVRRLARKMYYETTMTPELEPLVNADRIRKVEADVSDLQWSETERGMRSERLDCEFDAMIACTGYRLNVANLSYVDDSILNQVHADDGQPRLTPQFETTVPGLFVVGALAEFNHGPAQRFLLGQRSAAISLGKCLGRRLSGRSDQAKSDVLTADMK